MLSQNCSLKVPYILLILQLIPAPLSLAFFTFDCLSIVFKNTHLMFVAIANAYVEDFLSLAIIPLFIKLALLENK